MNFDTIFLKSRVCKGQLCKFEIFGQFINYYFFGPKCNANVNFHVKKSLPLIMIIFFNSLYKLTKYSLYNGIIFSVFLSPHLKNLKQAN